MKRLINKAFLTPSVEQLLVCQADSWTSKTMHDYQMATFILISASFKA